MLTKEDLDKNVAALTAQLKKLLDFEGENGAEVVNNADWTNNRTYIDFLREVGVHYNVNMMTKARNCVLEIGGNDQWSNIISGVDLVRKTSQGRVFAIAVKLITNKDGKKMGKTEKGALWLSAEKLTPFEFFQYLRNIDDEDIEKVYKMVSITDIEEIEDILKKETNPNIIKEKLAYDITKRIHGKEEADKALNTAREIFSGKVNTEALPVVKATIGENMLDVCIKAGFGKSRGDIKKLIASNSISLGEKLLEVGKLIEEKDFEEGKNILKKGKKVIVKLEKE